MSLPVKQGTHSTEHWHGLALELIGVGVMLAGAVSVTWQGVAIAGIGALLAGWAYASYASSRGGVKSAAVRRPADQAPRI